jgi:hypothetical protein
MSYQENQKAASVIPSVDPGQLKPESQMRIFGLTLFAPAFAVAAIALIAFAPTPSEIAMAFKAVGTPVSIVAGGMHDREAEQTIASRFKELAGTDLTASSDCFDGIGLATQDKLDRCSKLIYQALRDVDGTPFATDTASATDRKTLVQELKLAVTEVCRERWARDGQVPDNLSCQVAMAGRD